MNNYWDFLYFRIEELLIQFIEVQAIIVIVYIRTNNTQKKVLKSTEVLDKIIELRKLFYIMFKRRLTPEQKEEKATIKAKEKACRDKKCISIIAEK